MLDDMRDFLLRYEDGDKAKDLFALRYGSKEKGRQHGGKQQNRQ